MDDKDFGREECVDGEKGEICSVRPILKQLREEELVELYARYSLHLSKVKRKFKRARAARMALNVVAVVGADLMAFGNFSGILKNVFDVLAPVMFGGGLIGSVFFAVREANAENLLEEFQEVINEIEEEIDLRGGEKRNQSELKDIFSDIFDVEAIEG